MQLKRAFCGQMQLTSVPTYCGVGGLPSALVGWVGFHARSLMLLALAT